MCGITAVISSASDVMSIIIQSLSNLQNRGYDSAGVCTLKNGDLIVYKKASSSTKTALSHIHDYLNCCAPEFFVSCTVGIGHTRWATHGPKTDVNSHPHVCYKRKIAIVHNGIIENYAQLKGELLSKGITFRSQTDSEVIANMISFYNEKMPIQCAIEKTCKMMEGTWALAIISTDFPEHIFCTRHGSPLIMAKQNGKIIITSEQSGLYVEKRLFDNYVVLEESVVYAIDSAYDIDIGIKNTIQYEQWNKTPFPYRHWTIKEIHEQPCAINRVLNYGGRIPGLTNVKLGGLESRSVALLECQRIILLGCGTSHHSAIIASEFFENRRLFQSVRCLNAAEFDSETIFTTDLPTLIVCISQSGETKDLHKCLELCRGKYNIVRLGVINVVDSLIARETDCGVYLNAGREVGVASTKSFTSQVIALMLVMMWFDQNRNPLSFAFRKSLIADLYDLSNEATKLLDQLASSNALKVIVAELCTVTNMFILGVGGKDLAIALEAALKIKEITYIHCEGACTSALKHGPLALIQPTTPAIFLISNPKDEHVVFNAIEEVKARNGRAILIGVSKSADIIVSSTNNFTFLLNNIVLQYIAYHIAISKGLNPDFPRNLAKVVTVS